jgi:GNAT superfamily N-acetyltransferase
MMTPRNADASELDQLAQLWHDGWQEAHAPILPPELARFRTLPSFRTRLEAALAETRVIGAPGDAKGFSIIKGDELYQLYVSAGARGSGVASALIADVERILAGRGVKTAWLACAIGNDRAAHFYEKMGWRSVGEQTYDIPTPDGLFPLEVWRYEKKLAK